jgi:hypothetical protein
MQRTHLSGSIGINRYLSLAGLFLPCELSVSLEVYRWQMRKRSFLNDSKRYPPLCTGYTDCELSGTGTRA